MRKTELIYGATSPFFTLFVGGLLKSPLIYQTGDQREPAARKHAVENPEVLTMDGSNSTDAMIYRYLILGGMCGMLMIYAAVSILLGLALVLSFYNADISSGMWIIHITSVPFSFAISLGITTSVRFGIAQRQTEKFNALSVEDRKHFIVGPSSFPKNIDILYSVPIFVAILAAMLST